MLLALAAMLPTLMVTTPARAASSDSFTPAILRVMSRPSWFRGTDGKVHLAYELEVTNAFPVAITVTSIDVLDARGDRPDVAIDPVTTPVPIDRNGAGPRRDELPLGRDLVTFPGSGG